MPGVIGRDGELRQAATFLESIREGPASLLLNGAPGAGKTTLWEAVVGLGQAAGLRVLQARGSQSESALTFSGLTDLCAGVTDAEVADLPPQQRKALAAALLRGDGATGRHDRRAVSAAALTLLRRLSGESPVLIAIDDVQWCDRPTAHVVEYVVRRLDREQAGILCSRREPDAAGIRLDLSGPGWREHADVLDLAPLDDSSIGLIAQDSAEAAGRRLSLRQTRHICALAGGNPLFAVELGRTPRPEGLPTTLRELVLARVRSFPTETRDLLLLIATLRHPTLPQLADADGSPVDVAFSTLEAAADTGVLLPLTLSAALRFGHPLYAAGVRALAARSARRRAHLQAAQVAHDPEERVWHLALAATGPDDGLARQLDDAGEAAQARGAPEVACELIQHAVRLTPAGQAEDIFRRAVTVAELQLQAGEIPAARDSLEELLAAAQSDHQRARVLRVLGELAYHQDNFTDAVHRFTEGLELAHDPDSRAHILVHLSYVTLSVGGFHEGARHAAEALRLVDRIEPPGLQASVLAVSAITAYLIGNPIDEDKVARALELEDANYPIMMTLRPSLVVGHLRLYEGRLTEAVALLSAARAEALERGNDSDVSVVSATLAWAHWWHGNLAVAGALTEEAAEVADRLESDPGRCIAHAYGAVQLAFAGDLAAARADAERAHQLVDASGFGAARLWALWAQIVTAIQAGEPRGSQEAVDQILGLVDTVGLPTPVRVMALADAIEALIGAGDLVRAAPYLDILDDSATRTGTEWAVMQTHRCRAQHLAASGDLDSAWEQISHALEHSATHEVVIETARAQLVAGRLARRRRQRKQARHLLELALSTFAAAGATGFAAITRAELERVSPVASSELLTPTEELVADLAASGLTNRQVATRLNISPKTVEANLARVYRKLGISSRATLGAHFVMAPRPGGDDESPRVEVRQRERRRETPDSPVPPPT